MTPVSQPFEFVGGNLALDFVNTVHSGSDTLSQPGSASAWVKAAGLGSVTATQLSDTLTELRETLRALASALTDCRPISRRILDYLNETLARYPGRTTLRAVNGTVERWSTFDSETLDDIAGPIAEAAADLLTSPDRERVKQCPGCAMYFVDESRNRTRTWCSMKSCGNRAKVAAHYQRSRT